jgi:hypothetical protein
MSDQLAAELYERLTAGKRKPTTAEYPFNRGWNAGLDFALKVLREASDEELPAEGE